MEHNGHDKLNGIVNELYDNIEKTTRIPMMNILLMGATGVGKSSLINALFDKEVAKAGVGKPITQHLEKYIDEQKRFSFSPTHKPKSAMPLLKKLKEL